MNSTEISKFLTTKMVDLSFEQLNQVWQFIDSLENQKQSLNEEHQQKLLDKWQYLIKNHRELDPNNPLNDEEIAQICNILSKKNQSRPWGISKGEFTISDDFNAPLPDDILDLFYQ